MQTQYQTRFASLTALVQTLIERAPNPRPRARTRHARLTGAEAINVLARAAAYPGRPACLTRHGGSVANAYRYPAATTGVAVAAIADEDTVWVSAGSAALPANKVRASGVARRCITTQHGAYGLWWTLMRADSAETDGVDVATWAAQLKEPLAVPRTRLLNAIQDHVLASEAST